ncbi:hypothetical protein D3C76_1445610 [compost metagenome]
MTRRDSTCSRKVTLPRECGTSAQASTAFLMKFTSTCFILSGLAKIHTGSGGWLISSNTLCMFAYGLMTSFVIRSISSRSVGSCLSPIGLDMARYSDKMYSVRAISLMQISM